MQNNKTYLDYDYNLRGKIYKHYKSGNKYFLHGVYPSGVDKDKKLENCIVILTNIFTPIMVHLPLLDFIARVQEDGKEIQKFQVELK